MKINYRKIFISATILFVIGLFAYSFAFFPTGYVGTTRKGQVNLGCVCHADTANSIVNVQIIGPDSIPVNTTAFYRVKVNGGPAILGGFNIANNNDTVSLTGVPNDTMVRKQDGELTHTHPKPYNADTVSWIIRYTARSTPGWDTLYATSNSANGNGHSDGDIWNWSLNKPVRLYIPVGIINISSVAKEYSLSQNYPNPFNPVTQIVFSVAKASDIKIKIYDITGNEVALPVNEKLGAGEYRVDFNGTNLASGTYFYSLLADGKVVSTKKMLLVK